VTCAWTWAWTWARTWTSRRALLAVAMALAIGLVQHDARAHVRSASWSTWTVRGGDIDVRVRVARLDLSAHPRFADLAAAPFACADDERALAGYLEQRVRVETDAGPCAIDPASYQVIDGDGGFVVRAWSSRCGTPERMRITSDLLLDQVPSHLHFATLTRDGVSVAERLLTRGESSWDIGAGPEARSASVLELVTLGLHHVVTGADHLVFVLALLVAAGSLRAVAGVVTGFTIGHSVTLALAVLGGVRPDVATVEALVGGSIAVVAVENVWLERRDPWVVRGLVGGLAALAVVSAAVRREPPLALAGLVLFVASYFGLLSRSDRPAHLRWTVAALFGTVHGLAFSGALAEMSLPRARLASALLGFNVGVELAQLAVVALAWPLWRLLAGTRAGSGVRVLASAAALGAGTFWLIDRTFG
jgi:hypothetical protein